MVLDSFMESYRSNVVIKGNDADMAAFFEGVQPCTYEEAIETFFEAQYSVEAMAAITENAILMESAGAAEMVNEGVVGSFFSAAVEKVKECATKVKQFAVAVVKKIIQFFKDLYNKATPIDKIMQQYGKKAVSYSDIQTAIANGFKIPGSLKILLPNPEQTLDSLLGALAKADKDFMEIDLFNSSRITDQAAADKYVTDAKEKLQEVKEQDKERFTWVGQLISENDTYSKKNQFSRMIRTANEDKSKDGTISDKEWNTISDFALNGQAKERNYRTKVETVAKDTVKSLDKMVADIKKSQSDLVKNADDDKKADYATQNAIASRCISASIAVSTYQANRGIMIMNKVIIPVMRKLHTTAISTYIYITNGTKSRNKKSDKKAGIK